MNFLQIPSNFLLPSDFLTEVRVNSLVSEDGEGGTRFWSCGKARRGAGRCAGDGGCSVSVKRVGKKEGNYKTGSSRAPIAFTNSENTRSGSGRNVCAYSR